MMVPGIKTVALKKNKIAKETYIRTDVADALIFCVQRDSSSNFIEFKCLVWEKIDS